MKKSKELYGTYKKIDIDTSKTEETAQSVYTKIEDCNQFNKTISEEQKKIYAEFKEKTGIDIEPMIREQLSADGKNILTREDKEILSNKYVNNFVKSALNMQDNENKTITVKNLTKSEWKEFLKNNPQTMTVYANNKGGINSDLTITKTRSKKPARTKRNINDIRKDIAEKKSKQGSNRRN